MTADLSRKKCCSSQVNDPNGCVSAILVVAGSYCVASDSELAGPVGIWLGPGSAGFPRYRAKGQAFFGISYDEKEIGMRISA
jgi:hypothetical protein